MIITEFELINKPFKLCFPEARFIPSKYRLLVKSYYDAKKRLETKEYPNIRTRNRDLNKVNNFNNCIKQYEYYSKFVLNGKGIIIEIL